MLRKEFCKFLLPAQNRFKIFLAVVRVEHHGLDFGYGLAANDPGDTSYAVCDIVRKITAK